MMSNSKNYKDKKSIEDLKNIEDTTCETLNTRQFGSSPNFTEMDDQFVKVKSDGNKCEGLWALWANKGTLRIWSTPDTGGDERAGISKLFITRDGKVGLGAPKPSGKLQVAGDIVLEKNAVQSNNIPSDAARIWNDGSLHIKCPANGEKPGTLEVTGVLNVTGNIAANNGLVVSNGRLEAKNGMIVEGALTAGTVSITGGNLEVSDGLKVSSNPLEANKGMSVSEKLEIPEKIAVAISGGTLEAGNGLRVSNGLLEAKSGMTINATFTANCPVTVSGELTEKDGGLNANSGMAISGSLNANNGMNVKASLNVGPDNFVINSDGTASFKKKVTFSSGLDVTSGTLGINSLNVGGVTTEIRNGNAAVVGDLDIGGSLFLKDSAIPISIVGQGPGKGRHSYLVIYNKSIYDEANEGLRLSILDQINFNKVSSYLYNTQDISEIHKLATDLGNIYKNHGQIGIITSNGDWYNQGLVECRDIVSALGLDGLLRCINGEPTDRAYSVIFWPIKNKEYSVSETVGSETAKIGGYIINGSFSEGKPQKDIRWLWSCANGCAAFRRKNYDGVNFDAFIVDQKGDSHFYGTVFGKDNRELSDKRLKKCISPIKNVLPRLAELQGVSFEWNDPSPSLGLISGQKDIGFVAQDAKEIFPELVSTGYNGYLSLGYSKLTVLLLEAIKELNIKVESLQKLNAKK